MKRYATLSMMGVLVASLIGVSGASAHHDCDPAQVNYLYCGEHPRLANLPLGFKLHLSSAPGYLGSGAVRDALTGAMAEWNRYWPLATGTIACSLLCLTGIEGSASKIGAVKDGQNTISFTNDFSGCSNNHGGIGVACIWYEGNSGAGRHRIAEVDILLSTDKTWYAPRLSAGPTEALQVAFGELAGVYPELANRDDWNIVGGGLGRYDVQSVLTHELGHALGLWDIGDPVDQWPRPTLDTTKYQQSMYRWYYRGTTNKRSLGEGDIAGLLRIAEDVVVHGSSET